MARENSLLDKALAGVVGVTAGAAIGTHILRHYRRNESTKVVCNRCREAIPVEEVLDPTMTCACVAPRDSQEFR